MIKKILLPLLTILIFLTKLSYSQEYIPFPDSNAVWTSTNVQLNAGNFEKLTIIGDTVINSLIYKKLKMAVYSNYEIVNSKYIAAIRDYNKKWFFIYKETTEEKLLYDFSCNLSDTIDVNSYMDALALWNGNGPESLKLVVNSIDSVIIGGSYRKRIKLNFIQYNNNKWTNETWIDGIGSTDGLFYAGSHFCFDCGNILMCFKESGEPKYYFSDTLNYCDDFTSIYEKKYSKNQFIAEPNPVVNNLHIKLTNDIFSKSFYLYNVYGVNLLNLSTIENDVSIDFSNYKKGIYFLYIITDKNKIFSKKIIKN